MKVLTIDIGNTKIKFDLWIDSKHKKHWVGDKPDVTTIEHICKEERPERIVVSTVREIIASIVDAIGNKTGIETIDFGQEAPSFYKNEINYLGRLGPDRLAAFIGAKTLYPGKAMLVIDAGTAITMDVVDKKGNFCGGNISAGMFTRVKALAEVTGLLPEVKEIIHRGIFGYDTVSAIASGAVAGVVGEILFIYQQAKREYNVEKGVLSGGDAELIAPLLENHEHKFHVDPYLVARGLNRFAIDFGETKLQNETDATI